MLSVYSFILSFYSLLSFSQLYNTFKLLVCLPWRKPWNNFRSRGTVNKNDYMYDVIIFFPVTISWRTVEPWLRNPDLLNTFVLLSRYQSQFSHTLSLFIHSLKISAYSFYSSQGLSLFYLFLPRSVFYSTLSCFQSIHYCHLSVCFCLFKFSVY